MAASQQSYTAFPPTLPTLQFSGKVVTVLGQGRDRHGRTIGDVILPDGTNLNHELVRTGMCWWYRKYAPGNAALAQLELEARAVKRGLWAEPNPIPPWEWRKGK